MLVNNNHPDSIKHIWMNECKWPLWPQDLAGKEQEKVSEVTRVRVELQEQIGHLQAERTAQGGLKEKIAALEREMKGT